MTTVEVAPPTRPIPSTVFSYVPSERDIYERLREHLQPCVSANLLRFFGSVQALTCSPLSNCIMDMVLARTQLFVPLLSPSYLASAAGREQLEQAAALARKRHLLILPVLARPVDLGATPLVDLGVTDFSGQALDQASDLNLALAELTRSIREGLQLWSGDLRRDSWRAQTLGAKRRVLAIFASPEGEDKLSLSRERKQIERELGCAADVELRCLSAASLDDIHRELLGGCSQGYELAHVACHHHPDGYLSLEDATGHVQPIRVQALADLLRRYGVRSVVFNACYGACSASHFACFDQLVAMKGAIGDDAALTFSRFFYRAFAQGKSMYEAFEDGRLGALAQHGCDPCHFDFGSRC